MEFLIRALDGEPNPVRPLTLPPLPKTASDAHVREAIAFLRRTSLPIDPRRQWPAGGMPRFGVNGKIAPYQQVQPGKALCVWGDAGWGGLVRQGKYRDRRFSDDLVADCVRLVRAWEPEPAPAWVTCIPSLRHPDLVPDFTRRLAQALGLPFHTVLEKTAERPEQKTMVNSTQQARNLDGALAVRQTVPPGLVLLVDDMVDSRWTLTVAGTRRLDDPERRFQSVDIRKPLMVGLRSERLHQEDRFRSQGCIITINPYPHISGDSFMKTTLELPDDLYRQAKALAVLRGQTMKQWLTELLRRELEASVAPVADRLQEDEAFGRELDRLTGLVGQHWQGEQDAVAAIREQRRG
jgi:hypothetical protein